MSTEDRLDALEADYGELRDTMTEVMEGIDHVAGAVERLESAVGEGSSAPAADEQKVPLAWVDTANDERWSALCEWVDGLMWTYELDSILAPCWPAHLGVAEELAALWQAWRQAAVTTDSAKDSDAMFFWHDRALAPFVHRLQSTFYPAHLGCKKAGEHREAPRPRLTDRRTISLAPSAESPQTRVSWRTWSTER